MTRLFIIRHGNTFAPGSPLLRIGSGTDLALVKSGIHQANALANHFAGAGIGFAAVFSGPLNRATQTARALADGTPVRPLELLNEIDHGPDEGRPENEVLARLGQAALKNWDERAEPPKGWIVNANQRVAGWRGFFARAANDWPGKNVALVTSNGAARFALLALDPRPVLPGLKLATGAYGIIEVEPGGAVRLIKWGVRPEPGVDPDQRERTHG
jgi:2,3-bisphosphoglycerate-dependent phosphoglycerate mutase